MFSPLFLGVFLDTTHQLIGAFVSFPCTIEFIKHCFCIGFIGHFLAFFLEYRVSKFHSLAQPNVLTHRPQYVPIHAYRIVLDVCHCACHNYTFCLYFSAKIMQTRAKKACFQFAECSLFSANITFSYDNSKSASWFSHSYCN